MKVWRVYQHIGDWATKHYIYIDNNNLSHDEMERFIKKTQDFIFFSVEELSEYDMPNFYYVTETVFEQ